MRIVTRTSKTGNNSREILKNLPRITKLTWALKFNGNGDVPPLVVSYEYLFNSLILGCYKMLIGIATFRLLI